MARVKSILATITSTQTYAKTAESPRQRDDFKLTAALLYRLAAIVENALTPAACA